MIKLLIIGCVIGLSLAIGRRPTASDHARCQFTYASELTAARNRQPNDRSRIEAYNIGVTGSPCRTYCRLIVGRITTNLANITSPDYLQCGRGMYCVNGRCVATPTTSVTTTTQTGG